VTPPPSRPSSRWGEALPSALALVALLLLAGRVVHVCLAPLATNDLWWHLGMGEVYAREGPWPEGDPLLHTAHADAPVQHEWLFGVGLHGVERAFGLQGLRLLHAAAAGGIVLLAFGLFRRRSGSLVAAAVAAGLFLAWSWWRLVQLRPDLVSIPATLAVYALLLAPRTPPSWPRVAATTGLFALWANLHSLFAVGLLLLAAALPGVALRVLLLDRAGGGAAPSAVDRERSRLRRLGAATGLGALASLANPRGVDQHLTFLTSSREAAIWNIADEWRPFDPLSWRDHLPTLREGAVSLPTWLAADAALLAFLAVAIAAGVGLWRAPGPRALERADPVHLALGAAGTVAALVSIRFLWMLAFPALFCLQAWSAGGRRALPATPAWIGAAATLALALAIPQVPQFRARAARAPASPAEFLAERFHATKYHDAAVTFLEEAGLEGKLFNGYAQGGFLGYRLAPRLRTFIDSRTEHYPRDVFADLLAVEAMRGARPGEDFVAVLDRRGVDVFFGTGVPGRRPAHPSTTTHLEGVDGWIPLWRSWHDGIYLRRDRRNRENLERARRWYARQGIPFEADRGFEPDRVLPAHPAWAEERGLVPSGHARVAELREDADARLRLRALARLGRDYALAGAYRAALEVTGEALALRPDAGRPRLQRIYALLRLDRTDEARAEALALAERHGSAPAARKAVEIAERYARLRAAAGPRHPALSLLDDFPVDG